MLLSSLYRTFASWLLSSEHNVLEERPAVRICRFVTVSTTATSIANKVVADRRLIPVAPDTATTKDALAFPNNPGIN